MAPWLRHLIAATFGEMRIEGLGEEEAAEGMCMEEAVVMRHNEGGMSGERMREVFDLLRCKAREYCNIVRGKEGTMIRMTVLLREGGRGFKNESAVVGVFDRECAKVDGCRFRVAHAVNQTFCDQVCLLIKKMSYQKAFIFVHTVLITLVMSNVFCCVNMDGGGDTGEADE